MPEKIRVLIVDDQAAMRQAFTNLLYFEEDITVVGTASNGQEALDKTAELDPQVVLMDTEMPVMDGLAATRKLKETHPAVAVIAMSSETRFLTETRLAGASDFLLKPFESEALAAAIRKAVEKPAE